ncbi:hypothetical protein GDO81_019784 [Engystomops pustulosus]|uniref:Uncharacterized protein n=1 Tax=Engystomops pustulosus TaxID=76066 RepID=A0AAV6YRV9_ENGPU|nr:hypothetical protein GDO81_019784 [Engystomops pustulosus]
MCSAPCMRLSCVLPRGEASRLCHKAQTTGVTGILGIFFTSLTKALHPQLLRGPGGRRGVDVPNFFHVRIMEATVLLELKKFFCNRGQICALPQFCL